MLIKINNNNSRGKHYKYRFRTRLCLVSSRLTCSYHEILQITVLDHLKKKNKIRGIIFLNKMFKITNYKYLMCI